MSVVSKCCNAEIEKRHGKFSPDNSGFYIHASTSVCSKCEDEHPDTYAYICDNCGLGTDWIVEVPLGEYCRECAEVEE